METHNNNFYYKPVPNDRTYEEALKRATFLSENGYVNLTEGLTFDSLLESLIESELGNKVIINDF